MAKIEEKVVIAFSREEFDSLMKFIGRTSVGSRQKILMDRYSTAESKRMSEVIGEVYNSLIHEVED